MHRRRPTALTVAALLALTACGGGSEEETEETAQGSGESGAETTRTIEHIWGTTEVTGIPERIVALGVTDADPVIALGTTPVAAATYSFYADGQIVGPWAEEVMEGETPELIESDSAVNLEQIAALQPDLIVAISSGIDETTYGQLEGIAPTLARPADTAPYTATRDQATTMIATALDREEEGQQLIDDANAAFEEAVAANPEFEGATGTVVLPFSGQYGAYTAGDTRGQFLDQLGLVLPPALAAEDTGESFFIELSRERLDLLEGDVLVALVDEGGQSVLDDDVLLQQLDVVQRGDLVVDDGDLRAAMTFNTVLSVPFGVDALTPLLAEALTD